MEFAKEHLNKNIDFSFTEKIKFNRFGFDGRGYVQRKIEVKTTYLKQGSREFNCLEVYVWYNEPTHLY